MTSIPVVQLAHAIARLESAQRLEEIQEIVRTTARRVVGADGATLVLHEGDWCFYADEDSLSPLWKGQRFPVTQCISGWAMLHRESVVVDDIRTDERIPQAAYQPTYVRSLAMVPIRVEDPLGAIGAYWASRHRATEEQVALLTELAEVAGTALERYPVTEPAGH